MSRTEDLKAIYRTDHAIEMVRKHRDQTDFLGEATEGAILRAEEQLELVFPPTYRLFLEQLGAGRIGSAVFYGLSGEPGEVPREFDVVAETLEERTQSKLQTGHAIVFKDTPTYYFALNCLRPGPEGECKVVRYPRGRQVYSSPVYVADDFGEFLREHVAEALGVEPASRR